MPHKSCVLIFTKLFGDVLGDRHQQNGTNYTLDLAAGLTQVLADGTNTYLYGNGRIAQQTLTTEYFLPDALGSVRQLADPLGALTLTQSYAPYGETVSSAGGGYSRFQFTGEAVDANGLTYLRARYLDSSIGRFTQRDPSGMEANLYLYASSNPINYTDPTGYYAIPSGSNIAIPPICWALVVPGVIDGPSPAVDVALITTCATLINAAKLGTAITATYIIAEAIPEVVEDVDLLCELGWTVALPQWIVAPQSDPENDTIRVPGPIWTETDTENEPQEKHVALGISNYLGSFWATINARLLPRNAMAYLSPEWQSVGLSDVPASMTDGTFHIAFKQAAQRAEGIHFNLQGITDPNVYATINGGNGNVYAANYVTAWELNEIKSNMTLCWKTTFYENNSPSPFRWQQICSK